MVTKIDDDREARAMTEAEADKLFQAIAEETIETTRLLAEYERRLLKLKADAVEVRSRSEAIIEPLAKRLSSYIKAHPERFAKTRTKKTPFGTYGIRKVSDLEITDEAALIASLKKNELTEAYEVTTKVIKKAVERLLRDGDKRVTGAVIREGERTAYTVRKELLENAKNAGAES